METSQKKPNDEIYEKMHISLIIREIQVKTVMRYLLTLVSMAIISKRQKISSGKDVE